MTNISKLKTNTVPRPSSAPSKSIWRLAARTKHGILPYDIDFLNCILMATTHIVMTMAEDEQDYPLFLGVSLLENNKFEIGYQKNKDIQNGNDGDVYMQDFEYNPRTGMLVTDNLV